MFLTERAARTAGVHPSQLPVAAQAPGANRYANFAVHRIELNRSHTKRFADAAHSADLTVHGLVCGVILAGVRGVLQPRTGPLVLTCNSAVDMRTRLISPIPPEIVQSAASWSVAILTVSEESDPLDLGRQVCESLRDDLAKGIPAYEVATFSPILAGDSEKSPEKIMIPVTIIVTNLHRIPDPPLPSGLEAVGWRISPLCDTPIPFAAVTRYDQRLAIDLSFSRNWYDDDMMRELLSISAAKIDRIVGA